MSELSALDRAIQGSCPTLMVPLHGELPALTSGKRLLMGKTGVFLEVRSRALHACLPIAQVATPYGEVTPFIRLSAGPIPSSLLAEAMSSAAATPDEVAFGIEMADDASYVLRRPSVQSASATHITYLDSLDDERLVIDAHSHGDGRAFFSSTDDQSDLSRPGPYIALVLGRCSSAPEVAARLVAPPWLVPVPIQWLRPLISSAS